MNLWDHYRGKITYLVLNDHHTRKLIEQSDKSDLVVFQFGDSMHGYRDLISGRVLNPNTIEQVVLMIRWLINHNDESRNYLVGDAYIMQSVEGTATKKGAAIKGLISSIAYDIEKFNKSLIFVSEDIDHTLRRNLKKMQVSA